MDTTLQHVVVADQNTVISTAENTTVVVTGIMGPPGASSISALEDVDKSELVDGATLIYRANTATWKATNRLDNQILEAGQF